MTAASQRLHHGTSTTSMSLRLHVRHPLGSSVVVRSDADGKVPLVLGRGRDVDIAIAGTGVFLRHCAVFLDAARGRWLIQDGNTRGKTSVNGVPLSGSSQPCPLLDGFVVTLGEGASAATLTVEQASVDAAEEKVPAPSPPELVDVALEDEGVEPAEVVRPTRAEDFDGMFAPEPDTYEDATNDRVDFGVVASPSRRRDTSGGGAMLGVLVVITLVTATIALLAAVRLQQAQDELARLRNRTAEKRAAPDTEQLPTEPTTTAQPQEDTPPAINISLLPDETLQTENERLSALVDPAGEAGFVAGLPPTDPLRASAAWASVVTPRKPAEQLAAYLAFQQLPASQQGALGDEVASREAALLDRLWWQQVQSLLAEETAVIDRTLQTEFALRALSSDSDPQAAEALREQLKFDRQRLERIAAELEDRMQYHAGEVPNLTDAQQLDRLRGTRDEVAYEQWRLQVLRVVLAQGRLPWDEDEASAE